jgi:hypothetical protein
MDPPTLLPVRYLQSKMLIASELKTILITGWDTESESEMEKSNVVVTNPFTLSIGFRIPNNELVMVSDISQLQIAVLQRLSGGLKTKAPVYTDFDLDEDLAEQLEFLKTEIEVARLSSNDVREELSRVADQVNSKKKFDKLRNRLKADKLLRKKMDEKEEKRLKREAEGPPPKANRDDEYMVIVENIIDDNPWLLDQMSDQIKMVRKNQRYERFYKPLTDFMNARDEFGNKKAKNQRKAKSIPLKGNVKSLTQRRMELQAQKRSKG